jgi:hypothetical protein
VKEAKKLVIRLDGRAFTIEVDVSEDAMIRAIISSLGLFIEQGLPIKVIQTSTQPLSKSQWMFSRILRNLTELGEWADEIIRLLHIQRTRL